MCLPRIHIIADFGKEARLKIEKLSSRMPGVQDQVPPCPFRVLDGSPRLHFSHMAFLSVVDAIDQEIDVRF